MITCEITGYQEARPVHSIQAPDGSVSLVPGDWNHYLYLQLPNGQQISVQASSEDLEIVTELLEAGQISFGPIPR